MPRKIYTLLACSPFLITELYAGELVMPDIQEREYLTVSLDARLRYEHRNAQGTDPSHAATLRLRPGFTLLPDSPVSLFFETEHTLALLRDYEAGPGDTKPDVLGNTAISDPETNEINQAYLSYNGKELSARIGRQRIILDKAQMVGNVGWRQNEQTYDGISVTYKRDQLSVFYAYINQVNRIFGSDAPRLPAQALEGDVHLFNASYQAESYTVGSYLYLMDFVGPGFSTNMSNNTLGSYLDGKLAGGSYHLEFAYQTEAGDKTDYHASYAAASYSKSTAGVQFKGGVEYLEQGFVTPLATVHAYNGFADAFIGQRLGTANASSWDGLTDFYLEASKKLDNGLVLKSQLHYFMDDSVSSSYGWELDFVTVKKLSENITAIGKAAYFLADDADVFPNDIFQVSVEIGYKF